MADELVIEVDAEDVLAMLDALGPAAETHVHDASGITAERIQQEWRARVRRATGRYLEAITREEAGEPLRGFRVYAATMSDPEGGTRAANFTLWQEEGTKYMLANPAMESAVDLEEGPHVRRINDALEAAIEQENG